MAHIVPSQIHSARTASGIAFRLPPRFRWVVLLLFMLAARTAQSQNISLDAPSPEIPVVVPLANYIIAAYGLAPVITGAQLGLLAAEDETSFSYGYDAVIPPPVNSHARVFYSVSRGSVGLAGSPIAAQSAANGAAGDIFDVLLAPNPNAPALYADAVLLGLTPLPGESNIDGLDIGMNGIAQTVFLNPVYFTVDAAAAARWGVSQSDILFRLGPGPAAPAPPTYATRAALGLVAGDMIDGLAVKDLGAIGVLDAPDHVYISLAPGSPSAALNGTATVIEVYPAGPVVQLTNAQLGLQVDDDVDAISINDPGHQLGVGPSEGAVSRLGPARPNPFHSSTMIEYALPHAGPARLQVFDVSGRLVVTLFDGVQSAGLQSIRWDSSSQPTGVPKAGVYLIRLESGGVSSVRRLVCLR